MIWAAPYKPSGADERWATENGFTLCWHMKVAEILQIKDHKARAAKLRELADCLDAGIVVGHNEVDLMKVIRRLSKQEVI